jgi:hypothetical protein
VGQKYDTSGFGFRFDTPHLEETAVDTGNTGIGDPTPIGRIVHRVARYPVDYIGEDEGEAKV